MDQQTELAHFTGEIDEGYCPDCLKRVCECPDFQQLLSHCARMQNKEASRILLSAHQYVWLDLSLPWRVRFEVSSLLWNKALSLCRENMLGRAA